MMVRLAFAIATALPGDILVVDEVIAAGDAFFMERAGARLGALARSARVLVMATHAKEVLEEFCTHALWLDQGVIVDYGPAREVWQRYLEQAPRFPDGTTPPRDVFSVKSAAPTLAALTMPEKEALSAAASETW